MSRPVKGAVLLALVVSAATLAVAAHSALTSRPHHSAHWDRVLSYARAAGRTKPLIPALTLRNRALTELAQLNREGPPAERSRAAMVAGLLELANAGQDRGNSQAHVAGAAAAFQRAVQLDPANDDAAYDLELVLTRAKAVGHPVGDPKPEKKKGSTARPWAQRTGSGY